MPFRRSSILAAVAAVFGAAVTAAVPVSDAAGTPRPVIGAPVTRPAVPRPGQPFAVAFTVTRSDTHGPLAAGTMRCDPAVGGKVIAHTESFRAGKARLAFTIPVAAESKVLTVRVTIAFKGRSATRAATFHVAALPRPALSVGDGAVAEGNAGTATLVFPVTLSAPTPVPVVAHYVTADGTATAGSDYTATSGELTIPPGRTAASISVAVNGDTTWEADETLVLRIDRALYAVPADGEAIGTITNDDAAPRSGHYTGSTAQWQFLAFDVGDGARTVSGLFFFADLTCDTPLGSVKGEKFEALGEAPVAPDGSFTIDARSATPYPFAIHFTVAGKLTAPGSASGTFRVLDLSSNERPFNGAHCWTGDVAWNAS